MKVQARSNRNRELKTITLQWALSRAASLDYFDNQLIEKKLNRLID